MNRFMKLAISLAKKSNPFPNPRVGAVVVKDGKAIGMGFHKEAGKPHAEIVAIQNAKLRTQNLLCCRGATIYVTLEPCSHTLKRTPPCTKAIIAEGISKVVYAMGDPNPLVSDAGARTLEDAGLDVVGPTDEKAARSINKKYTASVSRKPFVAIKMAMSADGRTATRTGDSKWISGEESRAYVHRLRAKFDAVMVGAGTVIKDDPGLTSHGKGKNPFRIIIDGKLRAPAGSKVMRNNDGKTIIATSELASQEKIMSVAQRSGAHVIVCGKREVDLEALVAALGVMGMKNILIEGGSDLNAKALEAGIVERVYLFIAPKIIGGEKAKGVIGGNGAERISGAIGLGNMKVKKIGDDILLVAEIIRPSGISGSGRRTP